MHRAQIPDTCAGVQIEASDPEVSALVSANAGSGKTHVLAQRVINLLLGGCDPAKILCITFTKAAAANMANRVFGTLAEWTTLDDAALDERIRCRLEQARPAQRERARRLFASALETPGGLKVQTIHAFCTRLLHQFPFEANVAARFSVLDDGTTARLLNDLTMDVLLEAAADPDTPLGRALAASIVAAADTTFIERGGRGDPGARDDHQMARRGGWHRSGDRRVVRNDRTRSGRHARSGRSRSSSRARSFRESEWPTLIEVLATS